MDCWRLKGEKVDSVCIKFGKKQVGASFVLNRASLRLEMRRAHNLSCRA